ncbi:hypothetical protein GCM10010191_78510 [Actinomadura vinacea]|uniref:AraC-type transcription regulator ligand-binding domain-containing protein n=1 Tax=Actinomadura vinacea TaxID=115336 RepID=A0ABN3K4H0_9ACTN
MLDGTGWVITRGGEPTALKPGDLVLGPFGADHGLSHTPCALAMLPAATMGAESRRPGSSDFEFLSGCYRLDHGQIHRFLRELPDVLVKSPDYEHHPQLRSLAALLGDEVAQSRPGAHASQPAILDLMLVHALRQWQEHSGDAAWPTIAAGRDRPADRLLHRVRVRERVPPRVRHLPGTVPAERATRRLRLTRFTHAEPVRRRNRSARCHRRSGRLSRRASQAGTA